MRLTQFGSVTLPQFNAIHNLPVPFRSAVMPLRGGGYDQDGEASYPESKVIGASFWVSPAEVSNVDDFINSLYTEASLGRRILQATLRDNETIWIIEAKLIQAATAPDARTYAPEDMTGVEGYERVQVSFELVYPYWQVAGDTGFFLDTGLFMDDGIVLDVGTGESLTTGSASNSLTVENAGGAAHENMQISIEGLTGVTATDVEIINTTTGESISWDGTLSDGDILMIKTLPQSIQKNGANEYANTTLGTNQVGFMHLELGDNEFEINFGSISGGNVQIEIKFARHYLR